MGLTSLSGEKELLVKIAEGDKQAFTTLFNHYQGFVFGFGKRLTRSDELALDIVQEVFLKLWQSRKTLAGIEVFGAYLNRLVRNHSLNVLRTLSRQIQPEQDLGLAEIPEDTTLKQIDYQEIVKVVAEVVDTLPPQQRLAYQLCHQQGLKYEEAAEKMQISPKTVHVHMKYALARIREHLKRNSIGYPALIFLLLREIN
ncbi:RNA polymerase sigma factor [Niabella beijingensis]|uniref:RNA polymerase sigma factor n=1 Tax=Niabella beijingensis TaxID=2872700 RepID=UPI001CC0717C|nr:RNA polymerase sigma-70 factor [Niabella beijingensis]MBZ4189434.1 RNA polymerase sigma-70 factor [Niabella beijingensis]